MSGVKHRIRDGLITVLFVSGAVILITHLLGWFAELTHRPVGQFVAIDGLRLHYLRKGSGQPVVFLHGNDGLLQDFMVSVIDRAAKGYQAIAMDRPGHGYSERPWFEVATAEVQARIIHKALQKLGIKKPILVGHSWSGALVLAYALRYPDDLNGIVLLSGVAYDNPRLKPKTSDFLLQLPIIGDLLAPLYAISERRELTQTLEEAFAPGQAPGWYVDTCASLMLRPDQIKAYAQDQVTIRGTVRALSPHYQELRLPMVIVTGDQDKNVPPEQHAYLLSSAVAQADLVVLPGAGHYIELTRPRVVMDAIDKIAKCSTSQGSR